jgi:hypothetical protein
LKELEEALLELKQQGISLNKRETAAVTKALVDDLKEVKTTETTSKFRKTINDVKRFISGPGKTIASILKTVLTLV